MKKLIALTLALSLVFALAACKSDDKNEETSAEETTVIEAVTNEEGETVEAPKEESEAVTNEEGETAAQTSQSTDKETENKPSNSTSAASKPSANKPAGNKPSNSSSTLDEAGLAALLNAQTKKIAASGKYSAVRTSSFTKSIDVGGATSIIDTIIKGVSPDDNLNSVVGDFLGIGTAKASMPKDKNSFDKNYQLKATTLSAGEIKIVSASNGTYKFTVANATNPQRNNATAMSHLTNDFITEKEVSDALVREIGSAIKLTHGDVYYKNITGEVTVKDGKIVSLKYSYTFDAALDLKAGFVPIHGTGAAKTTCSYTNIAY